MHPEIEEILKVESFLQILCNLQGQKLKAWMEQVQQSYIRGMRIFVKKLLEFKQQFKQVSCFCGLVP